MSFNVRPFSMDKSKREALKLFVAFLASSAFPTAVSSQAKALSKSKTFLAQTIDYAISVEIEELYQTIRLKLAKRADHDLVFDKAIAFAAKHADQIAEHAFEKPLIELSAREFEALMARLQRSNNPRVKVFMATLRQMVFEALYTHPSVTQSLGFPGTLQPVGFPDQHLPPHQDRKDER